MPRADFRKIADGAIRNSFMHSLLAKGRLLYTHDQTIHQLCDELQSIGERDTQLQLLAAARGATAVDLQSAQVFHHASGSRLHCALDPLLGHLARQD